METTTLEKPVVDDDSDKESAVGELIADIFGDSDEEEFEGFKETEVEKAVEPAADDGDQSSEDEGVLPDNDSNRGLLWDFDVMLEKKKAERTKRKKQNDFISNHEDMIFAFKHKMREAAQMDRDANEAQLPAINKMKMLDQVESQLKISDLHESLIDGGILEAIAEWLSPLPDRSLPCLRIRSILLKYLSEFPNVSAEGLKTSGIGKAVMYLYKHPKEIRENKERAGKLIHFWSRPIFNLTCNYSLLSREEREQRDYAQLPKKRKLSVEGDYQTTQELDASNAPKPGEKGWIGRARVPQPSTKDYVVRPKWKVEEQPRKGKQKKSMTRYEKSYQQFKYKNQGNKSDRAVCISIEGRNMSI